MASPAELGLCRSLPELIPVARLRPDADILCLLVEQTDECTCTCVRARLLTISHVVFVDLSLSPSG